VTIDILCKVVDNYGDIGVAWRLARALSELPDPPRLRLVVDDLEAFVALRPGLDPRATFQVAKGIEVVAWQGPLGPEAAASFRARPASAIVECFACGRPDWLEDMLFAPGAPPSLVVDLEHLTAEPYAAELHLMPSLTRSASVRKAMFLPGFDEGTGGLVLDRSFEQTLARASSEEGRAELRRSVIATLTGAAPGAAAQPDAIGPVGAALAAPDDAVGRFWVAVFGYERDYGRIVADLAAFAARCAARCGVAGTGGDDARGSVPAGTVRGSVPDATSGRPLLALAAAGKSQACFLAAWEAAGRPFPALALPFLPQETWDRILAASDFSIVRGEDSWARAALAGRPFLWQAYPQAERHQMVKVEAFLRRLQRHFRPADFAPIARAYRAFNDRDRDESGTAGDESPGSLFDAYGTAAAGFQALAASLAARTNLAADLLTFFRESV